MTNIEKLEKEIELLKLRNLRIEKDKLWETSYTRRLLIAVFTFLSIGIYMWAIGIDRPWLNAIVPTVGFTLSTLSLPWFKELWHRMRLWFKDREIMEAIRIGEEEEKAGKLKTLSKDLHELLE
ncbi:hypothetical protein HZB69_02430 [Candidatus Amesbacteria bacterium]|nr:hypothetical protein [Candidatus Amesbacteria bacterium]